QRARAFLSRCPHHRKRESRLDHRRLWVSNASAGLVQTRQKSLEESPRGARLLPLGHSSYCRRHRLEILSPFMLFFLKADVRAKPLQQCAFDWRVGNRYHFLRNAAAIFSIIHRSPTQISHNAIRNPMTSSRRPVSFQKDFPPPGIYDGACAIAKRNPSLAYRKACVLISAEERHQQTVLNNQLKQPAESKRSIRDR